MNELRPYILALALFHVQSTASFAQPKDQNAAVKYLRADVSLHLAYPLPPDARVRLEQALEQPLAAEDEKLVAAASYALTEFQHGAQISACDWQMSAEDGVYANTSHRDAILELAALSALRARMRLRDADHNGAIADLLAAYAAARHLSRDGTIASVLIGYKIEREVTAVLQHALPLLTPAELDSLQSGLSHLPQPSTMREAVEAEKLKRNELVQIIGDARTRDELISQMVSGIPTLDHDPKKAAKLVDGCGGSLAGVMDCIEKQRAFYRKWTANFALPPGQFKQQYDSAYAAASVANPVLEEFTPMLSRFRWAEAYNDTRRALLQAAVRVQRGGAKELTGYPDPATGQPFHYTLLENGFVLESSLKDNGKAVSLSVTAGAKK